MAELAPIETPRLRIVPFSDSHLTDRYVGWLNDPEVTRYSEQRHISHDRASCRAYVDAMRQSANFLCAIELPGQPGYEHVGNISVSVDTANQLADIAILIGEQSVWGQGVGLGAWSAMVDALLMREGFRKVTGGTVAPNRAMVRIMRQAGMQPDGRRPAHHLINGAAEDVLHFAAFSDERSRP